MKGAKKEDRPRLSYGAFAKVLYNIFSFCDGYDAQTLSVVMRALEVSLGLSPSSLSLMATVECMGLLGFCPIWGFMADRYESHYVLSCAMALSGLVCILLGVTSNYGAIIFLRLIHGFSMSCSAPIIQKVITDSIHKDSRATHFGIYHSMACVGRLISAIVTTFLSMQIIFGFYGWRVCYVIFGVVWITLSVLIFFFMRPLQEGESYVEELKMKEAERREHIWETIKRSFSNKTSWILLMAVYISDAPFAGMVYMIMYLQYTGLSDLMSGVGAAIGLAGGVFGGVAGGFLVDACHRKWRNYGRLTVGTIVIIIRLVFTAIFFLGPMPSGGTLQWYHYLSMAIIGASLMTVSTIDRPILADVVPKDVQASANALNRSIAGIPSSATFLPLCALLAERTFGYVVSTLKVENMPLSTKKNNANALKNAMMYVLTVGTIINIACYVAFFFTYPADRDAIAVEDLKKEESTDTENQVGESVTLQ